MSIQSLSYTFLKILSVWIFVFTVLPSLFSVITYISPTDKDSLNLLAYYIFVSLAYVTISLILWFTANVISKKISVTYKYEERLDNKIAFKESKIIQIGLIITGFYVIIHIIPLFINEIIKIITNSMSGENIPGISYISIIQYLITLILAFFFIFGRKTLTKWVLTLRTIETTKEE